MELALKKDFRIISLVALAHGARHDGAGEAAEIQVRPVHPLHRQAQRVEATALACFEAARASWRLDPDPELGRRVLDRKDDWVQVTDDRRRTGWLKRSQVALLKDS